MREKITFAKLLDKIAEETRALAHKIAEASPLTLSLGKTAFYTQVNLADSQGQEIFKKLIQQLKVDIFVTNQLPKNYEKLGIAYELMKEIKSES